MLATDPRTSVALPYDSSDLAQTVERARTLLDDGDIAAARMLAAGVYDAAKAGAAFAARFGAAERLVNKARRLQGDALLIEARAKVRLADEYDAAQANGEASKGRPKSIPDGKTFTQAEVGLSAKEVHDARKLRDAERRQPGIVERAIAARLAAGLEPSRANLRAAVGTDSATTAERGDNLYETPTEATRTLLSLMRFSPQVWEPACGRGAISRMLEDAGYDVLLSDLRDYGTTTRHGELQDVCDFRKASVDGNPDIVTNPPYGADLNSFVAHALRVHRPRRMAMLLNLNFLCGFDDPDRCFAMDECPPARVYVFTRRLPMMHRDGWSGNEASSRMNTAWFVWELRGEGGHETYAGPTEIVRVDWKAFEDAEAAKPFDANESPAREEGRAIQDAPALTWDQAFEHGRILAKSGNVEVGAIIPDRDSKAATWSFWLGQMTGPHHSARTVDAAKKALGKRWAEFLATAKLAVVA